MDTTGDASDDFIAQFHNLAGDLVGERKHNLYKLIQNVVLSSTEEQCCDAVKSIQPRTYLESLFKVDLLIYLKRTAELTEILKEGDEVFISKILKQSWYFQEAFNSMDPQSLTNEFLPCMSYAMRMKILKKISNCWSEEKMDALFDALCERYGLHVAVPIFHTCSKSKIEEILKDNEIILRPNQVMNLFNRDHSLFILYVKHFEELKHACYDETKVLNYVALKNPDLLLELEKEQKVTFAKMGRRTSKKIVDLVKKDILKDIDRYTRLLNKGVIVRRLGIEFKVLYLNLFPKRIDSINMRNQCNNLLRLYPKNRRWELFAKTFLQVFPDNTINDAISKFHEEFLIMNPSKEIIQKWAEIKYNENKKHGDTFLKYLEPSKAIPLIKEKINVTSDIYDRTAAVMLLIETCAINKDLKALEEVLKYICFRHRNEDSHFRIQLYEKISSSLNLEMLNENHWKYINEQIKIDRLRKNMSFWTVRKFIWRYMEFSLNNNKDYKAAIIDFINDVIENVSEFTIEVQNLDTEKQILTDICKLFPEVVKIDSDHYQRYCRNLIKNVIEFSINHPDHCINLTDFSYFISFINILLNDEDKFNEHGLFIDKVLNYNITFPENAIMIEHSSLLQLLNLSTEKTKSFFKSAYKMFTKKERSDSENDVLKLYFEKCFDVCPCAETVHWFLRNDPRSLIPYFDKVIENSLERTDLIDSKQLRLYSHFEYDKKVCESYKAKFMDEECDEKISIINSLRVLLPITDFIEVVDQLQPKKEKLDLEDEEMQETYKLQCEVAEILHKVQNPSKIISLVLKFCVGDYLKSALASLYGVFYKSPEKLLYPYVDELSKRGAVSVKKHALFLSCEVLNKSTVSNFLSTKLTDNVSEQKHQFSATLKYFLRSPSQELLAQVMESMSRIDKNDTETFQKLQDATVPRKYRPMYIEKCWGFFENVEKHGIEVKGYLQALLHSMDADILKSLTHKFVIDVISRYLPLQKKEHVDKIEKFTIEVLEHRETERSDNLEIVFKILSKMEMKQVRSFFNVFIDNPNDKNRAFIDTFEQCWNKHFTITQYFEEHVAIKLLKIHLDCSNDPKLYAENIVVCLEQIILEFGPHAFKIFVEKLSNFMIYLEDIILYSIFHNILLHKLTPNTCILVLEIMNPVRDNSADHLKIFNDIIKLMATDPDIIVQSYYKKYLIDNDIEII